MRLSNIRLVNFIAGILFFAFLNQAAMTAEYGVDQSISAGLDGANEVYLLASSGTTWRLPSPAPSVGSLSKKKTKPTPKRNATTKKTNTDLKNQAELVEKAKVDAFYFSLVRDLMSAINQANLTNNYSVLHALGSAQLKNDYSTEDLSKFFEPIRKLNLDLRPIHVITPQNIIAKIGEVDNLTLLNITGNFPTSPLVLEFNFTFANVDGVWMVEGFSVNAVQLKSQN